MTTGVGHPARTGDAHDKGEDQTPATLTEPAAAHQLGPLRDVARRTFQLPAVDALGHPHVPLNLVGRPVQEEAELDDHLLALG